MTKGMFPSKTQEPVKVTQRVVPDKFKKKWEKYVLFYVPIPGDLEAEATRPKNHTVNTILSTDCDNIHSTIYLEQEELEKQVQWVAQIYIFFNL